MKKQKKLPKKLSSLIMVALEDLEAVERSPRYKVRMNKWHHPMKTKNVCQVCFAGSVMARTLKTDPNSQLTPFWDFESEVSNKLEALNSIRLGAMIDALSVFDVDYNVVRELEERFGGYLDITPYETNPKQFKSDMLTISGILKAEGY